MTKKLKNKKIKKDFKEIKLRIPLDPYHQNLLEAINSVRLSASMSLPVTPTSLSAAANYLLFLGARAYNMATKDLSPPRNYLPYTDYIYQVSQQLDALDAAIKFKTPYRAVAITSQYSKNMKPKWEDANKKEKYEILNHVSAQPDIFPPSFEPFSHLWQENGDFNHQEYKIYAKNLIETVGSEPYDAQIKQMSALYSSETLYYSDIESYIKELNKEHNNKQEKSRLANEKVQRLLKQLRESK